MMVSSSTQANNSLLLRNARVILPGRVTQASLLVESGRIASISESQAGASLASSVIDLEGLTLFPGFVDVHIHGAVGVDTLEASEDDLQSVAQFLASQGVTSWLPTLVPAPVGDYEFAVRAIEVLTVEAGSRAGARVLGVHYEGPFVNTSQCGALRTEHFKKYSGPSDLESLPVPASQDAVRMMTVAPEIEGGVELVHALQQQGWIVSIGHTRAPIDVLDQALATGARHMTHFMNAMTPLHHRDPGAVGWGLSHDDVTCDVIADGIHLDQFVLRLLLKTKGTDRLALISDSIAAAGRGDGEYRIWGETITVSKGRTNNSRGSIAGSVITMLDAAKMMLSLGASEVEVARMASTNPARLLRIDGECGTIEEGKRADLVALDAQRKVRLTIIDGRVVYQS